VVIRLAVVVGEEVLVLFEFVLLAVVVLVLIVVVVLLFVIIVVDVENVWFAKFVLVTDVGIVVVRVDGARKFR
jgi:hypothetical protein